jgi:hypothetical protein
MVSLTFSNAQLEPFARIRSAPKTPIVYLHDLGQDDHLRREPLLSRMHPRCVLPEQTEEIKMERAFASGSSDFPL